MKRKLQEKVEKTFKAEYQRLAKALGKKFTERVESVVEVIGRNETKAREAALAIGKALADCQDALRGDASRLPNNCDIYAAISGHPRCRLAPSALRNYARFYRLNSDLAADGKEVPLSMYHHVAVSHLGDIKKQRKYLTQALRQNLSVAEMVSVIKKQPKTKVLYFRDLLEMLVNDAVSMASQTYDAYLREKAEVTADNMEDINEVQVTLASLANDLKEGSR